MITGNMISAELPLPMWNGPMKWGVTDYISRPYNALVVRKTCVKHPDALCKTETSGSHGGGSDL